MPTQTYTPIATTTIASTTNTVTFTSIPNTYTDIILVMGGSMAVTANMFIRVGNGSLDSGSNYSITEITGTGTAATSTRLSSQTEYMLTQGAYFQGNEQSNIIVNFQNYSNNTTYKSWIHRSNTPTYGTTLGVGLWRSTSIINQISLYGIQNYNVGSTVTLYGIKSA